MEGCESARPAAATAAASRLPPGSERINCCTRPCTYDLCVLQFLDATFPDMIQKSDHSRTEQSYESVNNTRKVQYSSWKVVHVAAAPQPRFERKWPLMGSMKRAGFPACTRYENMSLLHCHSPLQLSPPPALCSDAAEVFHLLKAKHLLLKLHCKRADFVLLQRVFFPPVLTGIPTVRNC